MSYLVQNYVICGYRMHSQIQKYCIYMINLIQMIVKYGQRKQLKCLVSPQMQFSQAKVMESLILKYLGASTLRWIFKESIFQLVARTLGASRYAFGNLCIDHSKYFTLSDLFLWGRNRLAKPLFVKKSQTSTRQCGCRSTVGHSWTRKCGNKRNPYPTMTNHANLQQ